MQKITIENLDIIKNLVLIKENKTTETKNQLEIE